MRQSGDRKNFLWCGHVIENVRKLASTGFVYEDWGISVQRRDKEILNDKGFLVLNPIYSRNCDATFIQIFLSNLQLLDDKWIN